MSNHGLNHVIECPLMHSIAQASLDIKEIAKYFVMRKPVKESLEHLS